LQACAGVEACAKNKFYKQNFKGVIPMMDDNCIFCKIIKGDIPSNKVYEDDKMIAIHDVAPAAPVHVLLLPKEHTANVTTADPALVAYMLGKVKEIAEKTGIYEKGFRVVMNTGEDGGQTVNHLHIHVIGGKALGWPPC
jgi:histidine triad (HIT) family protein